MRLLYTVLGATLLATGGCSLGTVSGPADAATADLEARVESLEDMIAALAKDLAELQGDVGSHAHEQASCEWRCVDTPGTRECGSDEFMAGISFPGLDEYEDVPPPITCSDTTNSDDVALLCCTME